MIALFVALLLFVGPAVPRAEATADLRYVGSAACADCHPAEHRHWTISAHALALRDGSIVAPLLHAAAPLSWGEAATAKPAGEGAFSLTVSETDVAAGPHAVPLVLGGRHLLQPLLSFPGGRSQALPVGYDVGKKDWFDIFARSPRRADEWGHWANRGMTANSECIACHVTGFAKGFVAARDSYATAYAEAGVGCEACHGPGSRHVEDRKASSRETVPYATPAGEQRLASCATCHALRRELGESFRPGAEYLDHYEPVLLEEGEYRSDGSVVEEAYEWGSFLQSRMYREGVSCNDCHDAHSSDLRAEGDALCQSCHDKEPKTPEHSHHDAALGVTCVSCHMPESVFMERDRRRDHAFSLPDPKLSEVTGGKSACAACHAGKDESWASGHVETWFPATAAKRAMVRELAAAFEATAADDAAGLGRVLACATACDSEIRRATATKLLSPIAEDARVSSALVRLASDPLDLVRYAAVWALAEAPVVEATRVADARAALLAGTRDTRRAIRQNAAWGLRGLSRQGLTAEEAAALQKASSELVAALSYRADSAESRFTLGSFYEARRDAASAIAAYEGALGITPAAIPPRYRLAVLLAEGGNAARGAEEFRTLLRYDTEFAPAHFALGLLYGQQGAWREAVRSLTECLKIEPYYPEALHSLSHAYLAMEEPDLAKAVLEAALAHPRARAEALRTLVSVNRELGDADAAERWAEQAAAEEASR